MRYRTIFTGKLVQQTALSVGGQDGEHNPTDSPIARDGKERPTIRGTTLAGALVDTCRKRFAPLDRQFHKSDDVQAFLQKYIAGNPSFPVSCNSHWRFFTSHPVGTKETVERRQGVALHQKTNGPIDRALFDMETLPAGTEWRFILEVKNVHTEIGQIAEALAAQSLLEWQRGRCWIGRSVARGLGWMVLTDLKAYCLTDEHFDCYPIDTEKNCIDKYFEEKGIKDSKEFHTIPEADINQRWHYITIGGCIEPGKNQNGYGLDVLSVGGHEEIGFWSSEKQTNFPGLLDKLLWPVALHEEQREQYFNPDQWIVQSHITNQYQPFIPGSGLRGPLRHTASRLLRYQSERVRYQHDDEHSKTSEMNLFIDSVFGTLETSAALLVKDAQLDGSDWILAWFHNHAEDEFTAGAYESSKFDRMALIQGKLKWKLVIEAPNRQLADCYVRQLKPALLLAQQGHVSIGGAAWRGFGWVPWKIDKVVICPAGTEEEMEGAVCMTDTIRMPKP